MPERRLVVVAFSGGLDTSYCVASLAAEADTVVHTVTVNTGGFSDTELAVIEARAYALGATRHVAISCEDKLYRRCLRYLVFGNVLRGGVYPLSVGAERAFQAAEVARYARENGANAVAHGSTGAGNDQVRFDVVFRVFLPDVPILTPVRDARLSREEEISFLRANGIDGDWSRAMYSINTGIWGTTIGGAETLASDTAIPEDAYPTPCTATGEREFRIGFEQGEPFEVDGVAYARPLDAVKEIDRIAAPFAAGRGVHVGDTILGSKGRIAFEAAAPLAVIQAHRALEKHTLTRTQQVLKDAVAERYGAFVHEAQFFEPALRDIERYLEHTQKRVTGTVRMRLEPYRCSVAGVASPYDLMSPKFGRYGEMNLGWTGEDVRGFARILANQTAMYYALGSDDAID